MKCHSIYLCLWFCLLTVSVIRWYFFDGFPLFFFFFKAGCEIWFCFDEFLLDGEEKGVFLECTLSVLLVIFNFWNFDITKL